MSDMPSADLSWILTKRPEFSDIWCYQRKLADIQGKPPNVIAVPPHVRRTQGEEWWADLKRFAELLGKHENRTIQVTDREPNSSQVGNKARG